MDRSKKYITPTQSERSRRGIQNDQSQLSSQYTEGLSSSMYTVGEPQSSFQTPFTTDLSDAPSSSVHSPRHAPNESIRLMPVKVKDIMEMLKNNPAYRDKSPVMINMKENDIDQIIEQQRYVNSTKLSGSHNQSFRQSLRGSPMSARRSGDESMLLKHSLGQEPSPRSLRQSFNRGVLDPSSLPPSDQEPGPSGPPLAAGQAQQVYAMTDIQAYPMIGGTNFRANKSRRKKAPRSRSRRKITPGRRVARKPRRKQRSKSRKRPRTTSRSRSRQAKSRPKKVVRVRSRKRSPVVVVSKRRYPPTDPFCCTPYPLCDNECMAIQRPIRSLSRPLIRQSRVSMTCDCNLCMEKLQFIQPSVCSKKKYMWTNEYAIIPKPQINLIDPCEELDPAIYPRADNPCIRDGRGNPLTDCIGRPLRDPIGKKFLNFNANGSVMDTNIRGNFYTGQPPVCVKCTLPDNTCKPDTTHNWWMSCGYPVRPNMNPFFKHVIATENQYRR